MEMYKAVYGPESPQIKQLEQQLATAKERLPRRAMPSGKMT